MTGCDAFTQKFLQDHYGADNVPGMKVVETTKVNRNTTAGFQTFNMGSSALSCHNSLLNFSNMVHILEYCDALFDSLIFSSLMSLVQVARHSQTLFLGTNHDVACSSPKMLR